MTEQAYNLRLVQVVNYENDQRWNYPFNLYPYHTLYLVEGGDGYVKAGNTVTALKAGEACLIPAFTLYSCWCESAIKKTYVEFFLEAGSDTHVIFEQGKVRACALPPELLRDILNLQPGESLKDSIRFEGELLCILSLFMDEQAARPSPEWSRLRPLMTDIHMNLGCDLQLGELARRHGFSPSSLSHAFKRAFSCTPKQYIQQLLANVIKHQLLHTNKSVSQLAQEYRFCDAYYLSNFYKRLMGISPQNYRELSSQARESGRRILP